MNKQDVVKILYNIGVLLEIQGENLIKSKAYFKAASALEQFKGELAAIDCESSLKTIKGIDETIIGVIEMLMINGRLKYYEELTEDIPEGLIEMMKIPGLGPKRVKLLFDGLGINSVAGLKYECDRNVVARLKDFGPKIQSNILNGIRNLDSLIIQYIYPYAAGLASEILGSLSKSGFVIKCSEIGSLRRKEEVVKEIDLLASTEHFDGVMNIFTSLPLVMKILEKDERKSSVVLKDGIKVNLRVVSNNEYPFALHYYTASEGHIAAITNFASRLGININERSIIKNAFKLECENEEDIYKVFGIKYIPPELRENCGEIEAALNGQIPELIEQKDIKGVLHVHSSFSDGKNTIEELALYCIEKGYKYLGISDHSQSSYFVRGLKVEEIKRQFEEIDRLNSKYTDFLILKGIEADILPDGSLDYDDEVLSWFDFTVASVHAALNMDKESMTERVLKAVRNKYVSILGHPTGRILLAKGPLKLDIQKVIKICAEENVIIEINSNPHRLDLDWRNCILAKEAGCKLAVDPDAHSVPGIDEMRYGINNARRGWLTKEDIVNTMDAHKIKSILCSRRLK